MNSAAGLQQVISVPIACLRGEPADIRVHNGGVAACDRSHARMRRQNRLRTSRLRNQSAKFSLAHEIVSMIDKVSEALRLQPVMPCSSEISVRVRRRRCARPMNQRRRAQKLQRNAAIGAASSRANDLDHARAHVVAVGCNARRTDRSRKPESARSSDCDWRALSPFDDSVLGLGYRVIQ